MWSGIRIKGNVLKIYSFDTLIWETIKETKWPFVNLGIETSALKLELELDWYYKRHYFQFHKAYEPQTLQGDDLGWEGPTYKVT